jgi:cell wall-associated NlpC family hydrolase
MKILGSSVLLVCFLGLADLSFGQVYTRPRIVTIQESSQPSVKVIVSQSPSTESVKPSSKNTAFSEQVRSPFLQNIVVVGQKNQALLKENSSSQPLSTVSPVGIFSNSLLKNSIYGLQTTQLLLNSIRAKLGIPYRYGANGPNYYDCSGFIWSVFQDAGVSFERMSAKSLWEMSEPVSESEKYKFGTLVFFNRLGHVGIVADKNGFYHASRSKGVVYSRFDSYWGKRIVGFRRLKIIQPVNLQPDDESKAPQKVIIIENEVIIR